MALSSLILIVQSALAIWFVAIFSTVFVQMANGRILLTGMLGYSRVSGFRFHRLQMLFVTLLFAVAYVIKALSLPSGAGMPNVPVILLFMIFGSQSAYLGGVALTR